jgi:hypothetical protein
VIKNDFLEVPDINLYRYVDNSIMLNVDLFGLWKIDRDSTKPIAAAYAEKNDTFSELAQIIGLDVAKKEKWLTLYDNEVLGAAPICGKKYGIPNEFIMAWFGEMDTWGQWWTAWDKNKTGLKQLGFHIRTFNNDVHTNKAGAQRMFLSLVKNSSDNKALQGIYMMGHGNNDSIGSEGAKVNTKGPSWKVLYATIGNQLQFGIGAVVIRACQSNESNAKRVLTNESTTAIFSGCTGTYIPIHSLNILGLWSNGKQGTNKL